jgi:hypothetical protein
MTVKNVLEDIKVLVLKRINVSPSVTDIMKI